MTTGAFFESLDEGRFLPTGHSRGPWDAGAAHGGPPAALLGRACANAPGGEGKQVVRIVLDILRPVPLAPLELAVEVVRPGRRVDLIAATLASHEGPVMTASAWRMRTAELPLEPSAGSATLNGPRAGEAVALFEMPDPVNYLAAMEWSFTSGSFRVPGPATAWARMRVPLLEGEEPSPLTRVLTAVDSASGISGMLDAREWLFINTDLVVHLHRLPVGEWVCLEASTTLEPEGVGLATCVVHDERGPLGRSAQALLVEHRV